MLASGALPGGGRGSSTPRDGEGNPQRGEHRSDSPADVGGNVGDRGDNGRVKLPVMPPVSPMLAKPIGDIPAGQLYEPKWDGFRSIIFRDGDEVEIGSRNERPMTRYFPEVVAAVLANFPPRAVIDGEIVLADTAATRSTSRRSSSASTRPRAGSTCSRPQTPASFVAFDLLALGDDDLTGRSDGRAARDVGAGAGRRGATDLHHAGDPRPRRPRGAGSSSSRAPAWTG